MILDRLPRPLSRFVIRIYQQDWFHWFASIVLGFWDTVFGVIYRAQGRVFRIKLSRSWQNRPAPHYPIPLTDYDIPVKPKRSDASGLYIATLIATYADRAELQATLPPDAVLDPPDPKNADEQNHNGKHPVIYMLGYTQNLHRGWNPLPGINYLEFSVGIPSVRIKRKDGYNFPFFYLPTLYLNRFYPVVMGWMVGYRKHWGWVYGQDNTYSVATLGGKKILSAEFESSNSPPLLIGSPSAVPWRKLLDQPHANPFGRDDFLYLYFRLDWQNATLQSVRADLEIFCALPGLPPGKYHFQPLDRGEWHDGMAPMGAFRLCAPFELLSPFSRKALIIASR